MTNCNDSGHKPDTSRRITSNQPGPHPQLATTLRRHLSHRHRKPVAEHNLKAYKLLKRALSKQPRPLVLDSFCGTGLSTSLLAQRHPQHFVVGIDQSAHRLQKHGAPAADNYLLLQAQCEDIWQLLLADGLTADYHYLFYPNPWPKSAHLQRRVHGHASFRWLLALGGSVELRSNWQTYVEEFGIALHLAGAYAKVSQVSGSPAISLFERKYHSSDHPLWACTCRISQRLQAKAAGDENAVMG